MKTIKFKFGLLALLVVYGLLYIATSKDYPCDGICEKISNVNSLLRKDRMYVYGAWLCGDSSLCVSVKDSAQISWNALADTTCIYLNAQNLLKYRIVIRNDRGDTLANKRCP